MFLISKNSCIFLSYLHNIISVVSKLFIMRTPKNCLRLHGISHFYNFAKIAKNHEKKVVMKLHAIQQILNIFKQISVEKLKKNHHQNLWNVFRSLNNFSWFHQMLNMTITSVLTGRTLPLTRYMVSLLTDPG